MTIGQAFTWALLAFNVVFAAASGYILAIRVFQ
jgi:hypothetical protein